MAADFAPCTDAQKQAMLHRLEIIRQNGKKLSAILLDLMMPVMDGFTLLETLKEEDLLKYEKAARIVIKLDGVDAE